MQPFEHSPNRQNCDAGEHDILVRHERQARHQKADGYEQEPLTQGNVWQDHMPECGRNDGGDQNAQQVDGEHHFQLATIQRED